MPMRSLLLLSLVLNSPSFFPVVLGSDQGGAVACNSTPGGNVGSSPLHCAVLTGNIDLVQQLIDSGAAIDARDDNGNTPLMLAVHHGYPAIVQKLIDAGSKINLHNAEGLTALMNACANVSAGSVAGSVMSIDNLIKAGADVDLQHRETGFTALMQTIGNMQTSLGKLAAERLIVSHANLSLRDKEGRSALIHAAFEAGNPDRFAILKRLIELKVDLNAQDMRGWSALMAAAYMGNTEAVRSLLNAGAGIDLITKKGKTAYKLCSNELPKDIRRRLKPRGFFQKLFD